MSYDDADLYDLLQLGRDASEDDIRASYRELSRLYHPDKCKTKELVGRLLSIQRAYEILNNPCLKQHYDQYGFNGLNIAEAVYKQQNVEHNEHLELKNNILQEKKDTIIEDFRKRVLLSHRLINDLCISRLLKNDSNMKCGFYCLSFNPFIQKRPCFFTLNSWRYNQASVRHIITINPTGTAVSVSVGWLLGHKLQIKPVGPSSVSQFELFKTKSRIQLTNSSTIWGNTLLSITYPITKTITGITEAVIQNKELTGEVHVALQKSLGDNTTMTVSQKIELPNPNPELGPATTSVIEFNSTTGLSGATSIITCSLGNTSFLSFVVRSAKCWMGAIIGRINISNFELSVGGDFISSFFSKQKFLQQLGIVDKDNDLQYSDVSSLPVLPGIDSFPPKKAQISFGGGFGILSGIQFNTKYSIPMYWIDPFSVCHYLIKWHPTHGWLSIGIKIERLGTSINIPVILVWPVKQLPYNGMSLSQSTSFPPYCDPNQSLKMFSSCLSQTLKDFYHFWSVNCLIAITPILIHRCWVDVLEDIPGILQFKLKLTKKIILLENIYNKCIHKIKQILLLEENNSYIVSKQDVRHFEEQIIKKETPILEFSKLLTISPLFLFLLYRSIWIHFIQSRINLSDYMFWRQACLEQQLLQSTAIKNQLAETAHHGLIIQDAFYGNPYILRLFIHHIIHIIQQQRINDNSESFDSVLILPLIIKNEIDQLKDIQHEISPELKNYIPKHPDIGTNYLKQQVINHSETLTNQHDAITNQMYIVHYVTTDELQNYININRQYLSYHSIDVSIPLQASIKSSKLSLNGGFSKQKLQGFCPITMIYNGKQKTVAPNLFIRYTYGNKSYLQLFEDTDAVILP